jgi:hypothetical protein
MTSRDFCYWLQGFLELRGDDAGPITAAQAACVQRHLALVFVHEIDPSAGPPEHQAKLDAIHSPPQPETTVPRIKELEKLIGERVQPRRDGLILRC